MEHGDIAQLAAVAGALGSALVLLARGRGPVLGGLVVLGAAEAGLAFSLSGGSGLDQIASAAGAAATLAGLAVLAAAVAVLVRWPWLVPLAVLAAAPLRPPLDLGTSHRFLIAFAEGGQLGRLLPLYFVLATAALALGWRVLRGEQPRALPRAIALPAAAFFAFALASLLWADDLEAGANRLVFFTLPFAALLGVVPRAPFPDWMPRALGAIAVCLAALFAAVGLWQAATHELFFYQPNLQVSNANTDYFRVTSMFGDPSLYGRHVVLGIAILLVALATRRVNAWAGIALVALMWAGLLFSYSQSSMVALVVVTLAIAAVAGDGRVRLVVGVMAAVGVLAGAGYLGAKLISGESLNQVTSDRTERVEDTTRVIEAHPLIGVGIGGQPRASKELADSDRPTPTFVSHTTPLTVAAELGLVGLALYAWLLVGGARLIAAVHRLDRPLGLALGAAFLALFVHALSYSGFLEDPLTWVVLAVAAGYLTAGSWQLAAGRAEGAAASVAR
jgi:O-Antigen ligase